MTNHLPPSYVPGDDDDEPEVVPNLDEAEEFAELFGFMLDEDSDEDSDEDKDEYEDETED